MRLTRGIANDTNEVDLSIRGRLGILSAQTYARLSLAQRNGVLARFVSEITRRPEAECASALANILGLSIGYSRLWGELRDAWGAADAAASSSLAVALDGELIAAADRVHEVVDPQRIDALAFRYASVSRALAPNIALRDLRLLALGNRSIGVAVTLAPSGQLAPLTPLAPIGPTRLQAGKLAKDLMSVPASAPGGWVAARTDEQALRDEMAMWMVGQGWSPRFLGSYVVNGVRAWVMAIEDPPRSERDASMWAFIRAIRDHSPSVDGYGGFVMMTMKGPIVDQGVALPSTAVRAWHTGRQNPSRLRELLVPLRVGGNVSAHLSADIS